MLATCYMVKSPFRIALSITRDLKGSAFEPPIGPVVWLANALF